MVRSWINLLLESYICRATSQSNCTRLETTHFRQQSPRKASELSEVILGPNFPAVTMDLWSLNRKLPRYRFLQSPRRNTPRQLNSFFHFSNQISIFGTSATCFVSTPQENRTDKRCSPFCPACPPACPLTSNSSIVNYTAASSATGAAAAKK